MNLIQKKAIGAAISVATSSALIFGSEPIQVAAYTFVVILLVLCGIVMLIPMDKKAVDAMLYAWPISVALSVVQIYALAVAGFAITAGICAFVNFALYLLAAARRDELANGKEKGE